MTQNATEQGNHLAGETSPYLLQHAHNPVQWYPWGPEALDRARRENKPILLSVGYSACHWCHVMAHESFEDPDTAEVMNRLFVNIKVDREERPDLDRIYQTAHMLLTQRPGGWPLTLFLTPDDQVPFFAGTYFPREPRHGLPAFKDLLVRIAEVCEQREDDIRQQNRSLVEALQSMNGAGAAPGEPGPMPLDVARQQLEKSFDDRLGGFGQAPKFPHATNIERLLRHWAGSQDQQTGDLRALEMATFTLRRMALGGIYDQLGGGFCRYSVDDQWMIPHFEKMLYDNGPLLALYAQAWSATGDPLFQRVAVETGHWVMREMQSPAGGYYSSLDADSEGEEGRFYVWSDAEVRSLLNDDDYALFARRFGLDGAPNFEGKWHLHVHREMDELAREFGQPADELEQRLDAARQVLLENRNVRVWPGRDDKVLTSWNGLMIKGMAIAGRHLNQPEFVASAERALDFVRATLWRDGRLLATWREDRAQLDAYLDDYVFMIDAVLELLQARWRDGDLSFAMELADTVLAHFRDPNGGFFFTADDHETLIQRPKPLPDESTPSGNGVAAYVLGRLGHLLGETRYLDAAADTLKAAWSGIEQAPFGHTSLLLALEEYLFPPQILVLRGDPAALWDWQDRAVRPYAPRRLTLAIPTEARDLPGLLAARTGGPEPVGYLCSGTACSAPTDRLEMLEADLRAMEARAMS
ncbi:MAG TPA: thioredoxin domain-containing protein [Gammaproteobacteria bacterium]|nr:thioredoxin domain-containing protein [Gammaproteobacteria bacterium]